MSIKVALVTTWSPERCGVATYAEELITHVKQSNPDIEFEVIGRPFDVSVVDRVRDADIVHYNHVFALFEAVKESHISTLSAMGKKTVVTWQESTSDNRHQLTEAFDRVVVHQKTNDGYAHIPSGIWDICLCTECWPIGSHDKYDNFIGMAGFPFAFKHFNLGARIAHTLGMKLLAFIPASHHVDASIVAADINSICPGSTVITEFVHQTEIIHELSRCEFTMFPHDHAGGGISGSVRLGIAARRPVIISRAGRFTDLIEDYSDEFYIVNSAYPKFEEVLTTANKLLVDIKSGEERVPNRVIRKMCWARSAEAYAQVYRELMSKV